MLSEKSFCKIKALVNMVFGALSIVIVALGLISFLIGLYVSIKSGMLGLKSALSGVFLSWLGLFGLRLVLKDGGPVSNLKKADSHD